MQFHEKKWIYLISQVSLPGLFKIFWPAVITASIIKKVGIGETTGEEPKVDEDGETIDGCEADSLDSAIDPEEHKAQDIDDDNDEYIDSIVFKGKRIKKGSSHHSLHSHHFSSVGNLLQVQYCNNSV